MFVVVFCFFKSTRAVESGRAQNTKVCYSTKREAHNGENECESDQVWQRGRQCGTLHTVKLDFLYIILLKYNYNVILFKFIRNDPC